MISNVEVALAVARKETMEHFRTKRIFIIGGIFAATFFLIGFAGAKFAEAEADGALNDDDTVPFIVAFYFGLIPFLSFFGGYTFASVLGIVLSGDAIVGEWKDRTLFLLFSKPVSRSAVLAGKIVGAYASVLFVLAVVFPLGLGLIVAIVGAPSAAGWGNLFAFFGFLAIGLFPFVSLGIFCSTYFRTPVTSFIVALGLWLVGLPVLGRLGEIILFIQGDARKIESSNMVEFFHYFDPMNLLQAGGTLLVERDSDFYEFLQFFQGAPSDLGTVFLAMLIHSVIFLGLSFWIINKRDYA